MCVVFQLANMQHTAMRVTFYGTLRHKYTYYAYMRPNVQIFVNQQPACLIFIQPNVFDASKLDFNNGQFLIAMVCRRFFS